MVAPSDWDKNTHGMSEYLRIMEREGVSVSCWRVVSWRDRLRILLRGKIFLHVVGHQPPVALMVDRK